MPVADGRRAALRRRAIRVIISKAVWDTLFQIVQNEASLPTRDDVFPVRARKRNEITYRGILTMNILLRNIIL